MRQVAEIIVMTSAQDVELDLIRFPKCSKCGNALHKLSWQHKPLESKKVYVTTPYHYCDHCDLIVALKQTVVRIS